MKVYNSNQVSATFAGFPIQSGRADGDFIKIERVSEAFSSKAGADGEVTRSATNDKRAKITFILMQTARANAVLSQLHNNDLATPGGAGVGALQIRDRNGDTVNSAPHAWITKTPAQTFAKEAGTVEWELECDDLTAFLGGNPDLP